MDSLNKTGLKWMWLVMVVLFIDLESKFFILRHLSLGETVKLLPSLNLCYVCNRGAAFGFLSKQGGYYPYLLIIISMCSCMILSVLMYNTKSSQNLHNISYALINGGALSNLLERLWHGFVVDMIDFYVGDWHFATFNLADSAICFGVTLLAIKNFSYFVKNNRKEF